MSSVSIQQTSSAPDYIMKFINTNINKLEEIYTQGIKEFTKGMLGFKCSQKDNKMDVFFMNEEMILSMMQKESWGNLQNNTPENKKIFFVNDLDRNAIFLITI